MNFAFECAKHKSKPQNDGFYFDIETPRGHFFAVLDFGAHDYANLNPSLQGKLETIVSSFVSVSSFSADLFLGFLAKEINNFVYNLAEQSGGPELFCSAALCLLSDDSFSFLSAGDTRINVLNDGRLQSLPNEPAAEGEQATRVVNQLGGENLEAPMSDEVQTITLADDDAVLVMTRAVAEGLQSEGLPGDLSNSRDSRALCESLMQASVASRDDRTLLVISGPYERPVVAIGVAELSKSIASLETRLNALTEIAERKSLDVAPVASGVDAQFEQRLSEQIAELKDFVRSKAAAIDLLELDEKVKNLGATVAGKADTAEILELQRDVLKLGLVSTATAPAEPGKAVAAAGPSSLSSVDSPQVVAPEPVTVEDKFSILPAPIILPEARETPSRLQTLLIVLAISLAAGFAGGWLGSSRNRTGAEQWSVKTAGNQITISRRDGSNSGDVVLTMAQPLPSTGEQAFSSFADVQRYIDTIANSTPSPAATTQSTQPQPSTEAEPPAAVTEITIKPGDSLKKLAQRYNVPPERLMQLNPGIMRWPLVRIGQKIVVPAAAPTPTASQTPTPTPSTITVQASQTPTLNSTAGTNEVTVGPGDSLNALARRFNTTAERLKELNPQITNWVRIQSGQKVLVPASTGG